MSTPPAILCFGAVHWDIIGHTAARVALGDDLPGHVRRTPGGVAFNIAAALARSLPGGRPVLRAAVGDDAEGAALIAACAAAGLDTGHMLRLPGVATGVYLAIEGAQGLVAAICDGGAQAAGEDGLLALLDDGTIPVPFDGIVVADGNLSAATLARLAAHPALAGADLRLAAASPEKARALHPALGHPRATVYLNRAEAAALAGSPFADARTAASAAVATLGVARAVVTDGAQAVALACRTGPRLVAHPPRLTPARVTGAGDALMAAHIAAEATGTAPQAALAAAIRAAADHIAPKEGPAP